MHDAVVSPSLMQLRAPDGEVIARVEDKKLAASVFLLLLLVIGHSSIFENINSAVLRIYLLLIDAFPLLPPSMFNFYLYFIFICFQ